MTSITQTPAYRVAFSMYVALGGDKTKVFDSVDAIYAEIDTFYGKGSRITTESLTVSITENGSELYNDDAITGYKPVRIDVNVPQKYTDKQVEALKEESRQQGYNIGYDIGVADGYTQGESEGYSDGYAEGLEDGAEDQKALLEEITVTDNGVYEKEDGYKKVTVKVSGGGGDTGKPKIYNGFRFTGGDIAQVDFSEYDWSNVYDTGYFFGSCSHSTGDWSNFLENYNGKILSGYCMFDSCSNLTSIPQLDTSNTIDMSKMFSNCTILTSIPQFDTSNVTDMSSMFEACYNLTSIPQFDTSNTIDMSSMFEACYNLTSIPQFDTSNVTNMSKMFSNCSKLTSIPQFDTSNVTDMSSMFPYCSNLTTIPQLDTSNVTDMNSMFQYSTSLTSIPQLDTSNVTDMNSMFYGCSSLTSIPKLYCGKISSGNNINIADTTTMTNLTDLGGFEDLGKASGFSKPSYFLKRCPNLTKESVMNVINNLYDRKSAGYSVVTLPFNTNSLALLSDEEKAIATNKGWTLSS